WSEGTLHGRLERGRLRLRSRLARRGLAPSAGLLAVILSGGTASAVPVIISQPAPPGLFPFSPACAPPQVVVRAEEALRAMRTLRITPVAAAVFVAVILGTGAGILAYQTPERRDARPPKEERRADAAPPPAPGDNGGRPDLLPLRARWRTFPADV